ncbi:MAG: energy transducer TonB [candidate division Zixibacteria bacterium]|nr:energy transducer TonB [candidate division Zixibacteria bacterium]NIR65230.1 energy transducer TonB [candidate division Zixibacteria bacterium]NIS14866.1 energy transducer TonB [candidate division Zixibacteria bacterium]NIS46966.1 energy transducer TonB [candidate division Zixibacteria bacterium]NIT51388.1 energy transducer TonB [candidate division Zixibacteria bacterium]
MSNGQQFAQAPYGAFELKRSYQKHMLMGTLISCALPLLVMAVILLVGYIKQMGQEEVAVAADAAPVYVDLSQLPPPNIQKTVKKPEIHKEKIELPKIGIPNPVADEEVMEVQVLATNLQKVELSAADLGEGGGSDLYGDNTVVDILDDILPQPDEFVAFDEEPQLLVAPEPVYPEMAKKAGVTGTVWIKVLVDTDGNVRDAIIVKESGVNAGFEEAAMEAAWDRKYRPAMQNNQPVAVWVAYKVRFTLKN